MCALCVVIPGQQTEPSPTERRAAAGRRGGLFRARQVMGARSIDTEFRCEEGLGEEEPKLNEQERVQM